MPADTARCHNVTSAEDTSRQPKSPPSSPTKRIPKGKQRNACNPPIPLSSLSPSYSKATMTKSFRHHVVTTLMAPKRKRTPPPSVPQHDPSRATTFLGRDGLGAYIKSPESFPPSRVIYHTTKHVLINDMYPKSSIHLLLLPRSSSKTLLHPFEAFEDAAFLAEVKAEVAKAKTLVAKELKRRFGKDSAQEQRWEEQQSRWREYARRRTAEEAERNAKPQCTATQNRDDRVLKTHLKSPPSPSSPSSSSKNNNKKGRDWSKEIIAGIHAVPSMSHLHIHILSRDRHSDSLKHRRHYNSFATDFLVPLEAFPLDRADPRRRPGRQGYLDAGLKCWRCGREFGNQYARLKGHLQEEFEAWRKE